MILEEETHKRFGYYPCDLKPRSWKKIVASCDICGKISEKTKHDYHALCRSCCQKGKTSPKRKPKIRRICKECNKIFYASPAEVNNGGAIFCSHKCVGGWQSKNRKGEKGSGWKGGKVKRICQECGKEFEVKRSQVKKGGGKFCSRSCNGKWKSKNLKGAKSHRWKGGLIERACEECGKKFCVTPAIVTYNQGRFCSHECSSIAWSKTHRGKEAPGWKGGKIKCICQECNKEFEVVPSVIKKGEGKYCCYKCARKHRKIPTHHTKPELIFEDICKRNNLPFRYVGDGQLWIGNKGQKQLNPDFVECNGKKICVEVMGDYWHSPLLNRKIKKGASLEYRKRHYKKHRWTSIFIWESDLVREDAEAFVLHSFRKNSKAFGFQKNNRSTLYAASAFCHNP